MTTPAPIQDVYCGQPCTTNPDYPNLPVTGMDLGLLGAAGLLLTVVGLATRRLTSR